MTGLAARAPCFIHCYALPMFKGPLHRLPALALLVLAVAATFASGCRPRRAEAPGWQRSRPSVSWLKGQLHAHSANSHDGHAPPGEVVRWYEARGYDFIVLTDHDFVTATPPLGRMLVFSGAELTRNLRTCD